jgi:hypothetical protein
VKGKGRKRFFFEKKNQKTSVPQVVACGADIASRVVLKSQSFFASFCSQKEDAFFVFSERWPIKNPGIAPGVFFGSK